MPASREAEELTLKKTPAHASRQNWRAPKKLESSWKSLLVWLLPSRSQAASVTRHASNARAERGYRVLPIRSTSTRDAWNARMRDAVPINLCLMLARGRGGESVTPEAMQH